MIHEIPSTRETLRSIAHRIANTDPVNIVLDGYIPRSGPIVIKRLIEEAASLARYELGSRDESVEKLADLATRNVAHTSEMALQLWGQQALECIGEAIAKLDQRELQAGESEAAEKGGREKSARIGFDERYVSEARIEELRSIRGAKYDVSRLIRLLEELNCAADAGSWISVAALVRIVLDHIPPVFACDSFAQVVAHADGRIPSWKQTLVSLQTASRKIADHHIHKKIEVHESLPVFQQVDNRKELDHLLERIVVELRMSATSAQPR